MACSFGKCVYLNIRESFAKFAGNKITHNEGTLYD